MFNKHLKASGMIILIIVLAAALLAIFYYSSSDRLNFPVLQNFKNIIKNKVNNLAGEDVKIEKFKSEADFKEYMQLVYEQFEDNVMSYGGSLRANDMIMEAGVDTMLQSESKGMGAVVEPQTAGRVSETNVQVLGIDEPDIVKTDGENIYYSLNQRNVYYRMGIPDYMPRDYKGETKIIRAFPIKDMEELSQIENSGNLLLNNKILVVFDDSEIYGYDVSDPQNPEKKWDMELEDNTYLVDTRLYDGQIYIVTKTNINVSSPCPIRPLMIEGESIELKCVDIYHPSVAIDADSTFTAMKINPNSGEIEDRTSFVGSSNSSTVYMSEDSLYITYFYTESPIGFFYKFLSQECSDLVPSSLTDKLAKLQGYDLSQQSKMSEMQYLLEKYYSSLDRDERLRVENEFSNRMEKYHQEHMRELEKTGIIKIDLDDFKIKANGSVPGYPLNQFALDEYDGNLRIATTIGERNRFYFGFGSNSSINDVYVLNENLKQIGSIKDLGETEKIYSVRFLKDRGYVVTFRQIDPFYVLDLSNASSPELKGELKIPGYSSYLHPLADDIILGIGKEGSKVKLSVFDVSNPSQPQEKDKYMLDEYWSEAVNNHHAFLLDSKHEVFFMPGGKGAYIFSYNGNKLKLEKALSKTQVQRAIYLDDYMYIISQDEITVLDENNWQEIKDLDLK